MTNYLSIDHGTKNIGIAIKIDQNPIVPLDCLDNSKQPIAVIIDIIKTRKIDYIILGMPFSLSGQVGFQAKIVEDFKKELSQATTIPIEYIDERLSSQLYDSKLPNSDSLVASHLLDSYLQRRKNDQKRN